MDDPAAGPSGTTGAGAGAAAPSGRYVYLLTRLRTRQITMEEATELFSIMQGMIRAASTPSRPSLPPDTPDSPPSPVAAPPSPSTFGADADWLLILGLGAGVGLGTAVLKLLANGPPGRPGRKPAPPAG